MHLKGISPFVVLAIGSTVLILLALGVRLIGLFDSTSMDLFQVAIVVASISFAIAIKKRQDEKNIYN